MPPQQPQDNEAGGNSSGEAEAQPQEAQREEDMSLEELLYSTASYHAIAKPVALTMILTALCVVFVNTPETLAATQQQLADSYVAFDASPEASTATKVGLSVTNALIIVAVICAMTFVIVLLYKYRCLKLLLGYMILASAALLGFLGGNLFDTAIQIYNLGIDKFSYYFTLWNFALVGTGAIFWPHGGFPTWTTQGYLIATSVILAWQLSALDPWTSWALLIILALYDLCAVLTPCGPLKALVNLMQQDDSPDMPGLLYEAELPQEAQRPGRRRQQQRAAPRRQSTEATTMTSDSRGESADTESPCRRTSIATVATEAVTADSRRTSTTPAAAEAITDGRRTSAVTAAKEAVTDSRRTSAATAATEAVTDSRRTSTATAATDLSSSDYDNHVGYTVAAEDESSLSHRNSFYRRERQGPSRRRKGTADEEVPPVSDPSALATSQNGTVQSTTFGGSSEHAPEASLPPASSTMTREPRPRGTLPFAIAKLYKLPLDSPEPEPRATSDEEQALAPNELLARQYTPQQLKMDVVAIFPRNGGRIETVGNNKYVVKDRHGNTKRTLVLDNRGRVMEERQQTPEEEREEARKSNTIKLGLGDFIFYSVLVSKAALYSFTTFVACMLVVLAGLGLTLVLLAVYHKALPALPISIFLGVIVYLLTRQLIEPWFQDILVTPYYV